MRDTHAGATSIVTVAATVMTVGGGALVIEHVWLVDQRDTLKSATNAASLAATTAMGQLQDADPTLTDDQLKPPLEAIARRYIEANLLHLPPSRLSRAKQSLSVGLTIDRGAGSVVVTADSNLGGFLLLPHMALVGGVQQISSMQASAAIECSGSAIEVVLAIDVTASMHARLDTSLPAGSDNRRLNAVVKAAKALVNELRSTCDERSIAVGIVPWDKTVRVPSAATWKQKNWVNMGANRTGTIPSEWAGCVEDRHHDANPLDATALASATSMSLTLPAATSAFPVFIYPDTRASSVTPMANSIKAAFPNLPDSVKDGLETNLAALRDNDWDRRNRGPNYWCTATEMLPLTSTLATVDTALDGIQASRVNGGGTMAHLGVTWGRRMLAHSWREVWGSSADVHPINPADRDVTKVLILLTDGGNALEDSHSRLPGRLDARMVGVPNCLGSGTRPKTCRQGATGTFYSALGRLGPAPGAANDKAQGYYYPGWRVNGTTGAGSRTTEAALSALMKRSCTLARRDDVTVYTIGAMTSVHTRWRDALVACSGASGTADADRASFYFHAADGPGLERAFRTIARRVLTFRRVH